MERGILLALLDNTGAQLLEQPIFFGMVIAAGIAVSAATTLASQAMKSGAASDAGGQLLQGGKDAFQSMMGVLDRVQGYVQPYLDLGKQGANKLYDMMNNPQQALESLPGYQFVKQQGTNATVNSATAKGLGTSGNALKGIGDYVTGLADTTFGNQWQRIFGVTQLGAQTGGQLGTTAGNIANAANGYQTAGVSGGAAGTVGAANAMGSGIQAAGQAAQQYSLYDSLYKQKTGVAPGGIPLAADNPAAISAVGTI